MSAPIIQRFDEAIRRVSNRPVPGVTFFDCTPLLADRYLLKKVIQELAAPFRDSRIDVIIAPESRGYYFASALSIELNAGFVPARKPGKLPADVYSFQAQIADKQGVAGAPQTVQNGPIATYHKDYVYEMHKDEVTAGQNVLVVDDLLAKGGTAKACCGLAEMAGAQVLGCAFLIELDALGGAQLLSPHRVFSLLHY